MPDNKCNELLYKYLLIGFDKNTKTDEFFTGNKVKVEHNKL